MFPKVYYLLLHSTLCAMHIIQTTTLVVSRLRTTFITLLEKSEMLRTTMEIFCSRKALESADHAFNLQVLSSDVNALALELLSWKECIFVLINGLARGSS